MDRRKKIIIVSKRLLMLVGGLLVATMILFSFTFFFSKRFMISLFSFDCGVIGGFVSIQQRLKTLDDEELTLLSESWWVISVIPVFGGIFSLVLYLLFLSGILEGHLFPEFAPPTFDYPPTTEDIRNLLTKTYPKSPQDFALLAFWSFAAGFSERLVPQIIQEVTSKAVPGKEEENK